jgi:hypothetical protein
MNRSIKIGGSHVHVVDQYEVDPGGYPRLNALVQRVHADAAAGVHVWTVMLIHRVQDPEAAMDDMEMSGDNLIGIDGINCLICEAVYKTPADPGPVCPGNPR